MPDSVAWKLEVDPGAGQAKLAGELDFSGSPTVRKLLDDFVNKSSGEAVLDLAEMTYLDSSGLAVLIELRRKLTKAGRTLVLKDVQEQVEKIFKLTGVAALFGL